jgi:hypothetical protein
LSSPGTSAFHGSAFEGRALDALDWAREAGYECLHTQDVSLIPPSLRQAAIPYVWHEVRQNVLALEARGMSAAKGAPCLALVHNGERVYQMLFSSRDDLYAEDVEWLPVPFGEGTTAAGAFRFVQDAADLRFPFDLSAARDMTEITQPHLYIRAPANFGHWVLDFLTTLLSAIHVFPELDRLPLALAQLHDDQRRILNALGFEDERLHVLEAPWETSRIFRFETAYVPSSGRHPLGYSLVRERVAQALGTPEARRRRRLFLSRHNFFPRHRIDNEPEVESLLRERGFETLFPDKMDPIELLTCVSEAEMIALPFGAGNGNLAMCGAHCQILMLVPEFFAADRFDSVLLRVQRSYLLPFFERIHFVIGQPVNQEGQAMDEQGRLNWGLSSLDAPYRFDPKTLDHALLNAEKLLAWTRL